MRSLRGTLCLATYIILCACIPSRMHAQGAVFSSSHVLEVAHRLEARLKSGKNLPDNTGILEEHLDEATRVAARVKSGRAEFHQNAADVFFVLSGDATLITGGTIVGGSGTDEVRGDSIKGGTSAQVHKGDVVHVLPATPHQVILQPGHSFLYVVVKVPRKE